MQKVEAQHRNTQNQSPAQQSDRGLAIASPHGEQIAQLEAVIEASPQLGKLAHVATMANNSPQATAQRSMMNMIHNSPRMAVQRKAAATLHKSPHVTVQWQQPGTGTTTQREEVEEPLQPKVAQREQAPAKPNNTGLPDNLKSGIESLSGMSMDNVRVHYNSAQPAQLNALAYAQGTNIHVAPGQEQHLPHEAWHVVQQAQGRVQPTMQMKKDPAVYDFGDKGKPDGTTSTKVIDPKNGSRGLFKYKYIDGNIIDSFNGTNIADSKIANDTKYAGLNAPNISVAVAKHDLAVDYGDGKLTLNDIEKGERPLHFRHADNAHKKDRENKYTWHHLQDFGKMELIDMNVHGAMWHYGGIARWSASVHEGKSSDDDPSE